MGEQRYLVTARKYRPQLFRELVAQEHVSETLKNAIRLNRLAHAYLFSGPRGVGKTTAARILAKAINCTAHPEERDETAEPCRQCDSCKSFEEGRNLNIIEIDAASNNKVEDIRELRDTVRIPPQGNRKKVYIIDEVHMLSNAAFNALLKTLEEPPPYVLFIFATTEPHKVIPTILSRCQRFDFRRIGAKEIFARLKEICIKESIEADESSLMLLARKGDGALRDALSALDQAVSLCGSNLNHKELIDALGVVNIDLFFKATQHIINRDSAGVLRLVEEIVHTGYDLQEYLGGFSEHVRNLLVARTMQETSLIEATDNIQARYGVVCKDFSENDLLRILMITAEAEEQIKTSSQPRLRLEMALLKMVNLGRTVDLSKILENIELISRVIREDSPQKKETLTLNTRPTRSSDIPGQPAEEIKIKTQDSERVNPEPLTGDSNKVPENILRSYSSLFSKPAITQNITRTVTGAEVDIESAVKKTENLDDDLIKTIVSAWPSLIKEVGTEKIRVGALLQHGTPKEVVADNFVISVPDDFHRHVLEGEQKLILQKLTEVLGIKLTSMTVVIDTAEEQKKTKETAGDVDPFEYLKRKRDEDPVIRAIFEQFGGEPV